MNDHTTSDLVSRVRAANQRWLATEGLDDATLRLRERVEQIRARYPARPPWWRPRARREWDRLFGELCHWFLDPSIEIRIGADPNSYWMRRSSLDRGQGSIMPGPDYDENDYYAYLSSDGRIWRYGSMIGTHADIVEVKSDPIGATLAEYARTIEQRWRSLSDGERIMLMRLCCVRCGALHDGRQHIAIPQSPPWPAVVTCNSCGGVQ
jgi:hypothetical protein